MFSAAKVRKGECTNVANVDLHVDQQPVIRPVDLLSRGREAGTTGRDLCALGRVGKRRHRVQMSVAARVSPARYDRAVLSKRVAMPRRCLSLLKQRSTTLRPL